MQFPRVEVHRALANAYTAKFYALRQHLRQLSVECYEDFRAIPFTHPTDLLAHGEEFVPSGMSVTRVFLSGGTQTSYKRIYYTNEDWNIALQTNAELFRMCSIGPGDKVAILQPFAPWSIGPVYQESTAQIGALAIPLGIHFHQDTIANLLQVHQPTVILAPPSFLARLTQHLRETGALSRAALTVRLLVLAGEPLSRGQRAFLSAAWQAIALSLYGSAETDSLAVQVEPGGPFHFLTQTIFPEVDLREGRTTMFNKGALGNLLITTLARRSTPLIRYELGDKIEVEGPCSLHERCYLIRILGRGSQSIILSDGTCIESYQVLSIVDEVIPEFVACRVRVSTGEDGSDVLEVTLYSNDDVPDNELTKLAKCLGRLSVDVEDALAAGTLSSIHVFHERADNMPVTQRGKLVSFEDDRIDRPESRVPR